MATPKRHLELTTEQDKVLRDLELSPVINAKVKLRASIVRLNASGWSAGRLAAHFGRNLQSVHNDLDRYEKEGVSGLSDGKAKGAAPKFTPEIEQFMHESLAEDRVWNSSLLAEAIKERFAVDLGRESVRLKLRALGYSWKRSRYAPSKRVDADVLLEHKASLETLKRGHWMKSSL